MYKLRLQRNKGDFNGGIRKSTLWRKLATWACSTFPTNPNVDGYMAVFFFLVCHPSDEETPWGQPAPCGQPAPWSHPYSSQCGQSAPLVLNSYMAVFFFLVSHPSDEETPWGQPAPCGQPAPWSHPYSSQCGQSAPLVLNSYMAVFYLTPRVLTGHIGMSRDETRVLAGHMVLAGPMEFPHH